MSHCETIQEEERLCKTVQQEVSDSLSELGIENVARQQAARHTRLFVEERGLFIDKTAPLPGASIDREVNDSTARHGAIGNLEMKYIQFPSKIPQPDGRKELLHIIAENKKNSCLEIANTGLKLKTRHHYYAQIQGGMGISGRQCCDSAVYTHCGNIEDLHVERIYFDSIYWNALKQKLLDFCLFAIVGFLFPKQSLEKNRVLNKADKLTHLFLKCCKCQ